MYYEWPQAMSMSVLVSFMIYDVPNRDLYVMHVRYETRQGPLHTLGVVNEARYWLGKRSDGGMAEWKICSDWASKMCLKTSPFNSFLLHLLASFCSISCSVIHLRECL